jgi:hypothetical protein
VYPLKDAPAIYVEKFSLHMTAGRVAADPALLENVRDVLELHPGQTTVYICLEYQSGQKVFMDASSRYRVNCGESLIHELEQILGEDMVYVKVSKAPCRKPKRETLWKKDSNFNRGG